jgi:hypothetical protein
MDFDSIRAIKDNGFRGFKTIESLWGDRTCIPKKKGVYLVLDPIGNPDFINPGVGGFFKGRDPNVTIDVLQENHVPDSLVVYVGKAGGSQSMATLYSRLSQYLRFGQGKNAGHWGGRLIWQLRNHKNLIVCWRPTLDHEPREVERSLLQEYVSRFGRRPFANLSS